MALYIPDIARYDYLKDLPEGDQDNPIDKAVIQAMKGIEKYVVSLKDTLPKEEFFAITRKGQSLLKQLLKLFSTIPDDSNGDLLGKIYEFFLGKFGLEEAQKGGEFFTPTSVVKLMVEFIEPYHGIIFDPACGSGSLGKEIQRKFDDLIIPIFNEVENLQLQTQTLKQTRDLLLPRLISGKLKVKDAEWEMEKL